MSFPTLKREIDRLRILNWLHTVVPTMWNVYYVFNTSNTYYTQASRLLNQTYYDNTQAVHTSIESAYAATTSGRNDIILIDANSTHTLTDKLDVTKSRVNFIGMDGWDRLVQQWTKLEISWATDVAYVIKNTWTRNRFENIKVIQASTHANALSAFQDWWEWTMFKNFSATFGVADNLDQTDAHEFVSGTDSGTYINCQFGQDTLGSSAARATMSIDQVTSGQEFKSNMFKNCNFVVSTSSNAHKFIKLAAITDILFTNKFIDCDFTASVDSGGWVAILEAVQTWTGTNKGTLLFTRPACFNVTDFAVATGWRNAGVQVVAAVSVAAAIEWIQPTA